MARDTTTAATPTVDMTGHVLRALAPDEDKYGSIVVMGVYYRVMAPEWSELKDHHEPENSDDAEKGVQPMVVEGMTAQRQNEGKLMFDAVPVEWLAALASVMNAGEEQGYPYRNWEEGGKWSTPVGCMLRHFWRWSMCETYDKDGVHHLSKVAWNALQLLTWQIRGVGKDDLNRQTRETVSKVTSPEKTYD